MKIDIKIVFRLPCAWTNDPDLRDLYPNSSTDFATIFPSTKIVFIPEYSGDGVLCLD